MKWLKKLISERTAEYMQGPAHRLTRDLLHDLVDPYSFIKGSLEFFRTRNDAELLPRIPVGLNQALEILNALDQSYAFPDSAISGFFKNQTAQFKKNTEALQSEIEPLLQNPNTQDLQYFSEKISALQKTLAAIQNFHSSPELPELLKTFTITNAYDEWLSQSQR